MTTKRMRCYFLAIRCLRSKCCVIFTILSFIFLLTRLYQIRNYQIFSSMFKKNELNSQNFALKSFIPGSFLEKYKPSNISYCQFRFGLPEVLETSQKDVNFTPELGDQSEYRVLYNVVESNHNITNSITYCTHATPEFFYYLTEILNRWEGPVSISAFVPSTDASLIVCILEKICSCFPAMARVSIHFIYPLNHPPSLTACPRSFTETSPCEIPGTISNKTLRTYRYSEALTYPVNVARNVARVQSKTTFTLVSDVELFPSRKLVTNFIKMISTLRKKGKPANINNDKIVYVLPVFEVQTNQVPQVKSKLLELYSSNQAFYFHRWVCSHCQRFPGLQRWLFKKNRNMDYTIQPFFVVKREFPFHRWEPVFIGTNSEPLYSEMLTWEGQQDKMTQMHEMCLMKYHFVILDGAFLVHSPGVKRKSDIIKDRWRSIQQKKNSYFYEIIMKNINEKQSKNARCKIH